MKKNDIILDARIEKAIDINDVRSQIDFEGPRGKYEILDNVIDPSRRYVNSFRLAVQGQVSVEDNTKFEKALKEAWLSVRTGERPYHTYGILLFRGFYISFCYNQ